MAGPQGSQTVLALAVFAVCGEIDGPLTHPEVGSRSALAVGFAPTGQAMQAAGRKKVALGRQVGFPVPAAVGLVAGEGIEPSEASL